MQETVLASATPPKAPTSAHQHRYTVCCASPGLGDVMCECTPLRHVEGGCYRFLRCYCNVLVGRFDRGFPGLYRVTSVAAQRLGLFLCTPSDVGNDVLDGLTAS